MKITKVGRKKREPGRPRRPLSTYNIFFAKERQKILQELQQENEDRSQDQVECAPSKTSTRRSKQVHVGFANLANVISQRWKVIDEKYKVELDKISQADYARYNKELNEWYARKAKNEQLERVRPEAQVSARIEHTKKTQEQLPAGENTEDQVIEKDSQFDSLNSCPGSKSLFNNAMETLEEAKGPDMSTSQVHGTWNDLQLFCVPCDETPACAKTTSFSLSRSYEPYKVPVSAKAAKSNASTNQDEPTFLNNGFLLNGGFHSPPLYPSKPLIYDPVPFNYHASTPSFNCSYNVMANARAPEIAFQIAARTALAFGRRFSMPAVAASPKPTNYCFPSAYSTARTNTSGIHTNVVQNSGFNPGMDNFSKHSDARDESTEIPIEYIQRFFGIKPEEKLDRECNGLRRNSCMY